jgi:hypothetical protein
MGADEERIKNHGINGSHGIKAVHRRERRERAEDV